jgi:hypothetical protein
MNLNEYHKSINEEFKVLQNRVRNLIKHWPEDGRYKEIVLQNILKRFLPKNIDVLTGFCIRAIERGRSEQSKQIDIILYDSSYPVLFREGNFAIVPPEGIVGIIEVKSNINNQNFDEIINTCNYNGTFIYDGKKRQHEIFNGIFSYDGVFKDDYSSKLRESYNSVTQDTASFSAINFVSINNHFVRRNWVNPEYSLYTLEGLSFSYFISNLLETITKNAFGNNELLWYPEDKEIVKIKDF